MTAKEIIKQIRWTQLSDYEGSCPCSHALIKGINIDIHCWRTTYDCCNCLCSGVHVRSMHMDVDDSELLEVAKLIFAEITELWTHTDWELEVINFNNDQLAL